MSKIFPLLIFLCCWFCSCDNPASSTGDKSKADTSGNNEEAGRLNDALSKYTEPSQVFTVSAGQPSVVTGQKGTKINVNPADLETESGKPMGKSITVELKELTNQWQLAGTNAQTVSDGKLLVSGGAYYINLTADDEQLKLKAGAGLSVQFPKLADQEMALFYGQRDEDGRLDWQKAPETFTAEQSPSVKGIAVSRPDTARVNNTQVSETDAVINYLDGGDTIPVTKEGIKRRKKVYSTTQKLYAAINIDRFGWINCDRFLDEKDTTELSIGFHPQDSISTAVVYLVFKNINSVLSDYYYGHNIKVENLPVGYKVRLIAYLIKGDKVFAFSSDLTITRGQQIVADLKETSEKDFKKLIGGL